MIPDYFKLRQDRIDQEISGLGREEMSKSLQDDQGNDEELIKTDVFKSFLQKNSDPTRKKVLLVISGSHKDDGCNSQYYPNYLKEMAQSNSNCDFLVLNIDPHFSTNQFPEEIEILINVEL